MTVYELYSPQQEILREKLNISNQFIACDLSGCMFVYVMFYFCYMRISKAWVFAPFLRLPNPSSNLVFIVTCATIPPSPLQDDI